MVFWSFEKFYFGRVFKEEGREKGSISVESKVIVSFLDCM